jgi:hypothetical protein
MVPVEATQGKKYASLEARLKEAEKDSQNDQCKIAIGRWNAHLDETKPECQS